MSRRTCKGKPRTSAARSHPDHWTFRCHLLYMNMYTCIGVKQNRLNSEPPFPKWELFAGLAISPVYLSALCG